MLPPPAYLRGSVRLDLDAFGSAFGVAWSRMRSTFVKVECWQSYQELDANRSLAAFHARDLDGAMSLLRQEAEAEASLYERLRSSELDFVRIRLVQDPMTPYLEYELLNYVVRSELGETIEVVEKPADVPLPGGNLFDFLLFDGGHALIHDYGDDGLQRGGWAISWSDALLALRATARELRSQAVPLVRFLESRPEWMSRYQQVVDHAWFPAR